MANVFGILTALILLVAAFVAHKNSEAYDLEKERTGNQEASFKENQETRKALENDIATLETESSNLKTESEELAAELEAQNKSITEMEQEISQNENLLKNKEGEVAAAGEAMDSLSRIPELVEQMKETQKSISDLTNEIGVEEAKLSQAEQTQASLDSSLSSSKETNRLRRQKQAPADLNTRIRSVYNNWGFVTIAAGDRENIVKGSVLQVLRNGEPIAKLKVSAVEANTAAADVLKDTLKEGENVVAGDIVVASIAEEKVTPPAPPSRTSSPENPTNEDASDDAEAPEDLDVDLADDADAPDDAGAPDAEEDTEPEVDNSEDPF